MKILRGGSAEVKSNQWFKFDIELDESDLQAIAIKNELDIAQLTVINKYFLLTLQAELLVTVQMEAQNLNGDKSSKDLMAELKAYIAKLPKVDNNANSV